MYILLCANQPHESRLTKIQSMKASYEKIFTNLQIYTDTLLEDFAVALNLDITPLSLVCSRLSYSPPRRRGDDVFSPPGGGGVRQSRADYTKALLRFLFLGPVVSKAFSLNGG